MTNHQKIRKLSFYAIFTAIILLMGFTPIGYIKTGGLEIALILIPVVIGAIILGPMGGLYLGFMFGLTSFLQCVFGLSPFGATLLGINPFYTFLVCIPTRMLVGYLTGLIFKLLHEKFFTTTSNDIVAHIIACVSGALLNTLLFMSVLCLCFYNTDYINSIKDALGSTNILQFVLLFVGIQGLIEAVINLVVGATCSKTIYLVFKGKF